MRIEIVPNFLTQEEVIQLNNWAKLGVQKKWLGACPPVNGNPIYSRFTTRGFGHRFKYPQFVRDLSEKIRKFVGVDSYPIIEGHGRDGVVVSYTLPGGSVHAHRDPRGATGLATLRCNVLTQKADDGAELYVDGTKIDINVGDLHCYLVSEHEHVVKQVLGSTPRIMWMFGAHVPAVDWNNGNIKVNNGLS